MKNEPKIIKAISNQGFKRMLGIFLSVLAIVLFFDVGYIGKTLSFIPVYFFGYASYILYLALLAYGLYCAIFPKQKKLHIKWYYILPFVLVTLCLSVILSVSLKNEAYDFTNFTTLYNSYFVNYYDPYNLSLLLSGSYSMIGGGFFGYLLASIFYSMNMIDSGVYAIFSLILIFSFVPLSVVLTMRYISYKHKLHKKEKEEIISSFDNYSTEDYQKELALIQEEELKRQKEKEDKIENKVKLKAMRQREKEERREALYQAKLARESLTQSEIDALKQQTETIKTTVNSDELYNESREIKEVKALEKEDSKVIDLSKQVIKDARKLESDKSTLLNPNTKKVELSSPNRTIIFNNGAMGESSGLMKAHFTRPGSNRAIKESETVLQENVTQVANDGIKAEPVIKPAISASIISPNSQVEIKEEVKEEVKKEEVYKKPEQLQFDFNEPQEEINEDVIAAKPEFIEPEIANKEEEVTEEVKEKEDVNAYRPWVEIPYEDLLFDYEIGEAKEANELTAQQRMHKINEVFQSFKVKAYCTDYTIGPSVTRYHIVCGEGVSVNAVNRVIGDLSVHLGGVFARFEPLVMGKSYSGLEIPNAKITTVSFKECLKALPDREKKPFAVAFGKGIDGEVVNAPLEDFPHMLVSGTTGSGKSVFAHSIIMTLIMRNSPDDLRLVLIDPKRVELSKYDDMPHLLCPIITEPAEALEVMNQLVHEMDEVRNKLFSECHVVDIKEYNEYRLDHPEAKRLPRIVVFIDEYADLVDRVKDIARPILLLGQKARSCGIHLIISTQRPSTNVVNGVIKGNLPTHVALMTANSVDSITIIGEGGAEKLLGKGDMLVQCPLISRVGSVRLQSAFIQGREINRVVEFLKKTYETRFDQNFVNLSEPETLDPNLNPFQADPKAFHDDKYEYIKSVVMSSEYASISKIQREFSVGFSRAGKIFLQLQKEGIVDTVGTSRGSKVLIHNDYFNIQAPDVSSDDGTKLERCDAMDIVNPNEE